MIAIYILWPIRICITVIPRLPPSPPSLPPSPPLPSPPLPPPPPSLPPFPLHLVTQQIHCPFQPKQSPSIVQYPVRWIIDSTLHIAHLADVFIPTSIRLRWEAFSNATIIARKLFTQIPTAVYSQVLIYISMSELVHWVKYEHVQASKKRRNGFETEILILIFFSKLRKVK